MARGITYLFVLILIAFQSGIAGAAERINLLLITVDDMSAGSVGIYGSSVSALTPNIDQLARTGLRFDRAHVQVANCMPSRNVMWSGRYPHSNGVEGFRQVRNPGYPNLVDLAREAGYFTAIRHKLKDSTPYSPYEWDLVLDHLPGENAPDKKDAASYGQSTKEGIIHAKEVGKPFFLLINVADPHVPFYGLDKDGNEIEDAFAPSRIYRANDVSVPGFLVDDPVVRRELAHYYSSVRRADDAVGQILQALEKSGEADRTIVMLISDHGMPFPFAKTQLYHQSTHTPLIFRWPGVITAGTVDSDHMVSAVDILPTLVEAVGLRMPAGVEGRSFFSLLGGTPQDGRDRVFKSYSENSSGERRPMRAVQSRGYLYVFNPWSDGVRILLSATDRTKTHQRMLELAQGDTSLAQRMKLLKFRVPEEFYDIRNDPDCLVNLIHDQRYRNELSRHQSMLEDWMRDTNDPVLPAFLGRQDRQVLAAFMQEEEEGARKRREWKKAIADVINNNKKTTSSSDK